MGNFLITTTKTQPMKFQNLFTISLLLASSSALKLRQASTQKSTDCVNGKRADGSACTALTGDCVNGKRADGSACSLAQTGDCVNGKRADGSACTALTGDCVN